MMIGFNGTEPSQEVLEFVEEWGIGGVIFFARNMSDTDLLPRIIERFNKAAGFNIFTAIDQEGGLVLRILEKGSLFPSPMGLAASGDLDLTRRIYAALAREMLAYGLNWNLAPVLDINHAENPGIGARSFGETPETVCRFGKAAIEGMQSEGIMTCAKHFPGKGHAKVDSHLKLPIIPYSRDRLMKFELLPFIEAIKTGVDAIMTSHVFFPCMTSDEEESNNLPATMSYSVMTRLLRDELRFEGLLITDDLEMGAITETFGVDHAAKGAFAAGADILLICHSLERQKAAAEEILKEVCTSKLMSDRLKQSIDRIQHAHDKITGLENKAYKMDKLLNDHKSLVEEACRRSVIVHRTEEMSLPLDPSTSILFICPRVSTLVQVEEEHRENGFANILKAFFPSCECLDYDPKAAEQTILDSFFAQINLDDYARCVIFSYNAHLLDGQQSALREISNRFKNSVLVALRNPYDISVIDTPTAIASYGFRTPNIIAVLEVLRNFRER